MKNFKNLKIVMQTFLRQVKAIDQASWSWARKGSVQIQGLQKLL